MEVIRAEVELGIGALTATVEEGTAGDVTALSPKERRVARLICALTLVAVVAFVLHVLDLAAAWTTLALIVAAVLLVVLEFLVEGRVAR